MKTNVTNAEASLFPFLHLLPQTNKHQYSIIHSFSYFPFPPIPMASLNSPRSDLRPVQIRTSSPRFPLSQPSPRSPSRRIGIAVDLSDESAYAVRWAVDNYLRPGDVVVLLHVRSTSVLYGADWGSSTPTNNDNNPSNNSNNTTSLEQMEEEYDNFTAAKANLVAAPLGEAHVPVKIHIVKDHDMKERLCLEVERLGLGAVILGSRGSGAARRSTKGMLGSVSDYCVQHCACPVVVVRYGLDDKATETSDGEDLRDDC